MKKFTRHHMFYLPIALCIGGSINASDWDEPLFADPLREGHLEAARLAKESEDFGPLLERFRSILTPGDFKVLSNIIDSISLVEDRITTLQSLEYFINFMPPETHVSLLNDLMHHPVKDRKEIAKAMVEKIRKDTDPDFEDNQILTSIKNSIDEQEKALCPGVKKTKEKKDDKK